MRILRLLTLVTAVILTGCASNPMLIAPNQTIAKVEAGKSQVVFMRSSFLGSAISSSIYDVTSGEPEFIGIVANGTKIAYDTTPGERTFMVVSEAADFMVANLAPGKTYYSLITPRMGFWKARFSLWPIKKDSAAEHSLQSKDFKEWYTDTQLVQNSEKSLSWYNKNKDSVMEKYQEYWKVWQQKPLTDIATRTLDLEDGQ